MSHNIFGNRFYSLRRKPWHEIGLVSDSEVSATEALRQMGGGYWFDKREVSTWLNGDSVVIGYTLVRSMVPDDPYERNFGFASEDYNVIQPQRVAEIFDENVGVPVETVGMLGKGERLFITWLLPEIDIKGDKIELYGFTAVGYDARKGYSLNLVTTRVVCENTWSMAINEAKNNKVEGRGQIWSGRHNSPNVERDLSIWMAHVQEKAVQKSEITKNLFVKFAETALNNNDVVEILNGVYPVPESIPSDYPAKLLGERQDKYDKQIQDNAQDIELCYELFNGYGTGIDATAYGLFNAVTEYENWGRSTKKPPEQSILLGERSNVMNRAFSVINDYIDAK